MSATEYPLYSLPEGKLKSFSIKTMEEIEDGRAKKPEGKLPHSHDFYTVIWIKKGKGIHRVDFKDYPIAHNQLFFLHPGQVHSLQIEEESGYVCMFTLDFMCATGVRDSFLTDLHLFDLSGEQGPLLIRQEDEASFSSLIALMLTAQEEQEEESPEVISASLKLFLLMARKIQKKQQLLVASSLEDPSIIRSFKALVESHFQEWHKVHEYAGHLGITPNYLKDLVKSTLNASAKQYIQNRILLEAKRKVHFTDMNAKEIGFSLGFHDPAHFSKFFKQGTGMSLTAFKEEING